MDLKGEPVLACARQLLLRILTPGDQKVVSVIFGDVAMS
jgi:hypothetical protein